MILHLCSDQKFIDYTITQFENTAKGVNQFVILSKSKPSIVKRSEVEVVNPYNHKQATALKKTFFKYSAIVVHYLDYEKAKIVFDLDQSIKLFWFSWGADVYDDENIIDSTTFMEPLSRDCFLKQRFHTNPIKRLIFSLGLKFKPLKNIIWRYRYSQSLDTSVHQKELAIARVDFMSTVIPGEKEYMSRFLKGSLTEKVEVSWQYGNIEQLSGGFYDSTYKLGEGTLIGNSATITNNHLDIINLLKSINFSDEVYVPLNYGDKYYAHYIAHKYSNAFGENANCVLDFLPIDAYNQVVVGCCNMIMYHKRQQACGNIIAGIYLGMKVFMNEDSIVYEFLKNSGIKVYSLVKDFENHHETMISPADLKQNRMQLEKIWGKDQVALNLENTIQFMH